MFIALKKSNYTINFEIKWTNDKTKDLDCCSWRQFPQSNDDGQFQANCTIMKTERKRRENDDVLLWKVTFRRFDVGSRNPCSRVRRLHDIAASGGLTVYLPPHDVAVGAWNRTSLSIWFYLAALSCDASAGRSRTGRWRLPDTSAGQTVGPGGTERTASPPMLRPSRRCFRERLERTPTSPPVVTSVGRRL